MEDVFRVTATSKMVEYESPRRGSPKGSPQREVIVPPMLEEDPKDPEFDEMFNRIVDGDPSEVGLDENISRVSPKGGKKKKTKKKKSIGKPRAFNDE